MVIEGSRFGGRVQQLCCLHVVQEPIAEVGSVTSRPPHNGHLGRFIGRIHAVGAARPFEHRPSLDIEGFGRNPCRFLLEGDFLPAHIETAYRTLTEDLITQIGNCFETAGSISVIRLHGDCHPGNILWTDDGPHFVDLDDCRSGPAIQDLWMLLSG